AEIVRVMKKEGFIKDYAVESGAKRLIRAYLKYTEKGEPALSEIKRESKPGLRSYASSDDLPRVLGGMGVAVISTSSGVMTCREAKASGVGGEILCSMW
ncbi:MAG: 30S ribosomal protein S8, partial [Verrucomicrobiota bacterium]